MRWYLRKPPPLKVVLKNNPGLSGSNAPKAWSPNLWAAPALAASFWVQEALTQTRILFAKFVRLFIDLTPMQSLPRAGLGWPGGPPIGPHLQTHTWPHGPRAPGPAPRPRPPPTQPRGAGRRAQIFAPAWRGTARPTAPAGRQCLSEAPPAPQAANKRRSPNQSRQLIGPPVSSVPARGAGAGVNEVEAIPPPPR